MTNEHAQTSPRSAAHLVAPRRSAAALAPAPDTPPAPRASIATLHVNRRKAKPTPTGASGRYQRLRDLRDRIGVNSNRNDLATALIAACITEGVRHEGDIIRSLVQLGFSGAHVAMILKLNRGSNPAASAWKRDEAKRYSLLQ